jgi:hypothetical protein
MCLHMTINAQRNQILFLIATRKAPELFMVDLQILHSAAVLTAPTVALQDLLVKVAIDLGI